MGEVIKLALREVPGELRLAGEAVCTACKHRWAAVASVGTREFRCPQCDTMRGLFVSACWPGNENEPIWNCGCGSVLFLIRMADKGFMCRECGTTQTFNVLDSA